MALSTDYALRTGAFDPGDRTLEHTGVQGMSCEYHSSVLLSGKVLQLSYHFFLLKKI